MKNDQFVIANSLQKTVHIIGSTSEAATEDRIIFAAYSSLQELRADFNSLSSCLQVILITLNLV
jgi:hypothetical protein